jgi:hypothetical protein
MSEQATEVLEPVATPTEPAPAPAEAAPATPAPAPAPAPAAPEKYEFKAPEGASAFDDKVIETYAGVAKDLNLTQEQAQSVLDKVGPVIQARQMEALKTFYEPLGGMPDTWEAQTKADKEIGGDKLNENLAIATKVRDLGGPDFVKVLNATGLGNHPAIVKTFVRFGKLLSEDKFVAGDRGARTPRSQEDRLYGTKP